ncbi:FAD-binding and (Fe-S)-binding domain-containing protein [Flexithrix dorotheae]|uniref:FAD-binding and (Fe-S)-binding domain-containing protein n=1 Tax=Flexithrix dorotheae TaxID=70993 RepID=UPI000367B38C|nr:FAD-binding and (Fe-S)-binding domain-containing protein [Flexithrix dorotheae]
MVTTEIDKFTSLLKENIKGEVLTDNYTLGMYSTDASIYQIKPKVVVTPKDEEDVKTAIKLAGKFQVTILPRGGGTSLAGQTVGQSMVLDFSKYMNKIIEFNEKEQWVRVQPGLVRDELNDFLSAYNLHFAPDPATSSRANVGGMVGNNSSGTKSILYGKTVDHVLEANVLLADGEQLELKALSPQAYAEKCTLNTSEGRIYSGFKTLIEENKTEIEKRFPKVMRRVGGYNLDEFIHTDQWNLAKLITGSEGTLAVTLDLKLNLVPLPKHKSVCVVHYQELLEAIGSVESMLKYQPSAIEILDKTVVDMSRENITTKRSCHFIEGNPKAILIVEFYGDSPEDVMERPENMIRELKEKQIGYAYPLFPDGPDYEDVWVVRKKGLGLMLGIRGEKKPLPFIEDAGIPVKVLPEYIDRVLKVCEKHHTKVAMYAHASVGVIHVRPILDLRQKQDIENLKNITDDTFDLVMEYGGSWSGEHGDGLVRSAYNKRFFGDQIYNALVEVKKLFDPENRMNPGKIVEAQTIEQNLRYGLDYKANPPKTHFKYKLEQSFEASIDMCSGVGECRKVLGGTMCPSFKATRQEEHSTRGRANALRLAMSGQLGKAGLSSERLHGVMDLCLSCKACKSECPSNVDMAKMKSEVLQIYYKENGVKLRDKLIKNGAKAAQQFSGTLAPIINTIQKTSIFKLALEKLAGFDKRRTLPSYATQTFEKWYGQNHIAKATAKKVVLFADTYLNYHEPHIGIAAYQLLSDCGYEVILGKAGCCQRPKISHGFLEEAKSEGLKTLLHLDQWIQQGLKVVVCEPSCASALNDDLLDLIEDESLTKRVKDNVVMIDQFLVEEVENGHLKSSFEAIDENVLIHGHCHQKALYGTKNMLKLLQKTEAETKEIPSGCCGMAGSFGYEKEHYDISKKIGESILIPATQKADDQTGIVACGFSCRHQIADFAHKKARHFVEVLRVKK